MQSIPPSALEQLQRLNKHYASHLHTKLQNVLALWKTLSDQGGDRDLAHALHQYAHQLAGSGATFGFIAVSEAARRLEQLIGPVALGVVEFDAPQQHLIRDAIGDLVAATDHHQPRAPMSHPNRAADEGAKVVLIVEEDAALAHELALQLGYFGYTAQTIASLAELPQRIAQSAPAALLVGLTFPEGDLAGAEAVAALQRSYVTALPVIFIAQRSDMTARLQAVRAGGLAYVSKPIDLSLLVEQLDQLTARTPSEPYRVLIVDDDPLLAAAYAAMLTHQGMLTRTISNPLAVLEPLEMFGPDLILMDLSMPECTGQEVASVIRQQSSFHRIPIVFLSAETDRSIQLAALGEGGDDFLTKPIDPEHLVAAVRSRVGRARILRSQMIRDGLTGLLNHTETEARLDAEVQRARHCGAPLSIALIDIDHFKQVNDTYGHPAGDRVLKSLARLLLQRLRTTDIVGRYGGEEFLIVLPGADMHDAQLIFDALRASFAQLRHQSDDATWHVTFSCGVAGLPTYTSATGLIAAADRALYLAKRGGRNQVVIEGGLRA